MTKRVRRLCAAFLMTISLVACSSVPMKTNQAMMPGRDVRVHWIKKGEPAPFDGIELTPDAYKRLRQSLIECRYQLDMCTGR